MGAYPFQRKLSSCQASHIVVNVAARRKGDAVRVEEWLKVRRKDFPLRVCRVHLPGAPSEVGSRAPYRRPLGPPHLGAEHGAVSRRDDPRRAAAVHCAEVSREPGVLSGAGGCGCRGRAPSITPAGRRLRRRCPPRTHVMLGAPVHEVEEADFEGCSGTQRWQQQVARPYVSALCRGTHNTKRCRFRWLGCGSEQTWAVE